MQSVEKPPSSNLAQNRQDMLEPFIWYPGFVSYFPLKYSSFFVLKQNLKNDTTGMSFSLCNFRRVNKSYPNDMLSHAYLSGHSFLRVAAQEHFASKTVS